MRNAWTIALLALSVRCATRAPPTIVTPSDETGFVWSKCEGPDATWLETPWVSHLANGRSFGLANDSVAVTFVCGGILRYDGASEPIGEALDIVARTSIEVERRFELILRTLQHPEVSPRRLCTSLANMLNFELQRSLLSVDAELRFRLQMAYAILDDDRVASYAPPPFFELGETRPGGAPWLEPGMPLIGCEDSIVPLTAP